MFSLRKFLILILGAICLDAQAQLTIDNVINATGAVQDVLLGAGVTANNITFQGNNAQIAGFNCNGCGLGIGSGVVIGTGNVDGAAGPNDENGFSGGPPSGSDSVGDDDLEQLSGQELHNTAVLEFDFIPTGDSLAFNYVFSSEEYPDFVNQNFNDAFAFFLSGPGLSGPFSNNAMNIALVPGTTVPISINTVNAGEYAQYYNNNGGDMANIQANGFTTVLTAYAEVICGELYHIKIAIGDGFDDLYDSWVYLEGGSFQSNVLSLNYAPPAYSAPADGGIFEGCQPGSLAFSRTGSIDGEQTYSLSFAGNAIIGTDIIFPYTEVVFPPGIEEVILNFEAVQDFVLEGMETLDITLENSGCASTNATVSIGIYDLPALNVSTQDVTINCGQAALLEPQVTGGLGDYTITWSDGFEGLAHTVFPSAATTYNFTVSDTCGVESVSTTVDVLFEVNPPLVLDLGADLSVTCLDIVDIVPVISGGYGTYSYAWYVDGALQSIAAQLTYMSDQTGTIELQVEDQCGVVADDLLDFQVPAVPVDFELGADWEVRCIDQVALNPTVSGGVGSYTYNWQIDGSTVSAAAGYADFFAQTAELTLFVEDECGNSSLDAVDVVVPDVVIEVLLGDNVESNCITTNELIPQVSGGSGNLTYEWRADDALFSSQTQTDYTASIDTPIHLQVTDECGNTGSDSLMIFIPEVPIELTITSDTTICLYDEIEVYAQATGGIGALTIQWEGMSNNPVARFTPLGPSVYLCVVNDLCGNVATDQVLVNTDFIQPSFNSVYLDDETIGLTNLLPDSLVTFWEFSDGSLSNDHNTEHRFNTLDEWVATLHAYTPLGCHNTVSQTFQATGEIYIPNAFSPNGDGLNDVYKPVGRDVLSYHLTIFNRFGQVVFETRDMEEFWTGGYLGGDYFVMDGLYSFILRATDARYNTIERSGMIRVMR